MHHLLHLPLIAVAAAPLLWAAPVVQDPAMRCGTLENGLSYIIRPTSHPKGRASLRLLIRTGSLNETESQAGISHLLEHMVFNGSRHYKRGELIPAMQALGLGYGGDANAFTTLYDTSYSLDLPNLQEETVTAAFRILRDFADGATLEEEALEHERGIVISEKNLNDSVTYRAGLEQMEQLSEGSRLVHAMPIGREEVIRTVKAQELRRYYEEHYVPGLMTVIVTGDVAPEQAEAWVKEHFSSLQTRPLPPPAQAGTLTNDAATERLIANPEQANTTLVLAVMNSYTPREDTEERYRDELPLKLACIMLSNRLSERAKDSNAPLAKAGVGIEEVLQVAEGVLVNLSTMPTRWQEAMNVAADEIRKATTYGFSESELRYTLASLGQAHKNAVAASESLPADVVANGILASLQKGKVCTAAAERFRLFKIGAAQVLQKPELCREALAKAFDLSRVKLCMMGKLPGEVQPQQLREAYEKALQRPISVDEEKTISLADLNRDFGAPATVTERQTFTPPDVTTLKLSNGVRVNLKPDPAARGKIAVNAAVDGGILRCYDRPGLALMTDSVMSMGGIEGMSTDDIRKAYAEHSVNVNFRSDAQHFNIGGFTTAEDLECELKLIVAHLLHPGYRSDGEILVKRRIPAIRNHILTNPESFFADTSLRMVYGKDARFIAPTTEQIQQLSTKDVRAAVEPYLQGGAIELSLVGDFDPEPTIELIARTIGAIPKREAEFSPLPEGANKAQRQEWGQQLTVAYHGTSDKTVVGRLIDAGNGSDFKRNYRVQLLCNILQSRLFTTIREQLGEGYAPMVDFSPQSAFDNAALITVQSSGVMRNLDTVNQAMDAVLTEFASGNITEKETQLAIKPTLSSILRSYADARFWSQSLRTIQSEPDSLERTLNWYPEVESITAAELNELARELFGSGRINKLNIIPESTADSGSSPQP